MSKHPDSLPQEPTFCISVLGGPVPQHLSGLPVRYWVPTRAPQDLSSESSLDCSVWHLRARKARLQPASPSLPRDGGLGPARQLAVVPRTLPWLWCLPALPPHCFCTLLSLLVPMSVLSSFKCRSPVTANSSLCLSSLHHNKHPLHKCTTLWFTERCPLQGDGRGWKFAPFQMEAREGKGRPAISHLDDKATVMVMEPRFPVLLQLCPSLGSGTLFTPEQAAYPRRGGAHMPLVVLGEKGACVSFLLPYNK